MEREIRSAGELKVFAQEFLRDLLPHRQTATVIGLSGELGSGKTTFVQQVAHILGITEQVISPTFIIQKTYNLQPETHNQVFSKLIHIDAYRLDSGKELTALGFTEILADPQNLVMIEWPERVQDELPDEVRILKFEHVNETTRRITDGKAN